MEHSAELAARFVPESKENTTTKIVVFCHGDFDGLASASLILKEKWSITPEMLDRGEAEVVPVWPNTIYNQKLDHYKALTHVEVVDIAIDRRSPQSSLDFKDRVKVMMQENNGSLHWYDHHQPSMDDDPDVFHFDE